VERPPKSGIQIRLVYLRYQAQTWDRGRRGLPRSSGTKGNSSRRSDSS
jgi:hypothetical protein